MVCSDVRHDGHFIAARILFGVDGGGIVQKRPKRTVGNAKGRWRKGAVGGFCCDARAHDHPIATRRSGGCHIGPAQNAGRQIILHDVHRNRDAERHTNPHRTRCTADRARKAHRIDAAFIIRRHRHRAGTLAFSVQIARDRGDGINRDAVLQDRPRKPHADTHLACRNRCSNRQRGRRNQLIGLCRNRQVIRGINGRVRDRRRHLNRGAGHVDLFPLLRVSVIHLVQKHRVCRSDLEIAVGVLIGAKGVIADILEGPARMDAVHHAHGVALAQHAAGERLIAGIGRGGVAVPMADHVVGIGGPDACTNAHRTRSNGHRSRGDQRADLTYGLRIDDHVADRCAHPRPIDLRRHLRADLVESQRPDRRNGNAHFAKARRQGRRRCQRVDPGLILGLHRDIARARPHPAVINRRNQRLCLSVNLVLADACADGDGYARGAKPKCYGSGGCNHIDPRDRLCIHCYRITGYGVLPGGQGAEVSFDLGNGLHIHRIAHIDARARHRDANLATRNRNRTRDVERIDQLRRACSHGYITACDDPAVLDVGSGLRGISAPQNTGANEVLCNRCAQRHAHPRFAQANRHRCSQRCRGDRRSTCRRDSHIAICVCRCNRGIFDASERAGQNHILPIGPRRRHRDPA